MTEIKQPQLTHYFSKTMASDGIAVVSALHTNEDGSKKRVLYNISLYEGEGELSKGQKVLNEQGKSYLDTFKDAVKIGTSSQMDSRFELSSDEVKQQLLTLDM